MGANLLQANGSRDNKETRYAPIFTNRFFLGLATNRNPLRAPTGVIYENFYHVGSTDALIDGLNVELSNRLTLCRRPGCTAGLTGILSSAVIPDIPDSFYSFHEITDTIRVIVDTPSAPYLLTASAAIPLTQKAAGAGQSFYQGIGQALYFGDAKEQLKWLDFGAGNPGNSFATITNTSLTNNVATVVAQNNFAAGQTVRLSGTTNGGGIFNVPSAAVLFANSAQFTFALTHANVAAAADTGSAMGCWNWQIAAPTVAPSLNIVETGASAVAWTASTVFSTMGLIVDANGNIQQLNSVNLLGNTGNYGTTGSGQPNWNNTLGGTTLETSGTPITWQCGGQLLPWKASTFYANQQFIYDPLTNCVFSNFSAGGGTTGSTHPSFNAVPGSFTQDGTVKWGNNGKVGTASGSFAMTVWQPSHTYEHFDTGGAEMIVLEPVLITPTSTQPVFAQFVTTAGSVTSGSGYTPPWQTQPGLLTQDNQLQWVCLGSSTWAATTSYTAWQQGQPVFSVVKDAAATPNLWVCIVSGTSGSAITFPTSPNYGDTFVDGTVTWTCVGPQMTWTTGLKWYLPSAGFAPPNKSQAFGGASIVDSNNNVQFVTVSGLSGASAPSWATAFGVLNGTTDNTAKWTVIAPFSANSLSWTSGFGYCYAYKARSASDLYVTTAPPGLSQPLGAPTGSADASVSTASPTIQMATGSNAGAIIYVTLTGSLDPQVDTISIFRTADGGATYFWLTDVPNPAPKNGAASTVVFADFLPDEATAVFPGLNLLTIAPLAQSNNPPPVGFINLTEHLGRIFGSVGSSVFCSQGPLVGGANQPPGNGFTAFNPSQVWTFPSKVQRLVSTTTGLLVFTATDLYVIAGGPSVTTLFAQGLIPGLGLSSYNALAQKGGTIYLGTADRQTISIEPSQGISEIGFIIGDKLGAFNPASMYLAFLIQGSNDKALYVADGSTGWYRCNPTQAPDSAISGPVWSPKANIVGGCGAIGAVEVANGQRALLIGGTAANQPILVRDSTYTTFTDSGTAYSSFLTFGSIVLAQPGQLAELSFITNEYIKTGTSPKCLWLPDELSGVFEDLSGYVLPATGLPPQDPPFLYGVSSAPNTIFAPRYYFEQSIGGAAPQPACCRHMQMKVDFGSTDTVQNELLSTTIFGAHWAEK